MDSGAMVNLRSVTCRVTVAAAGPGFAMRTWAMAWLAVVTRGNVPLDASSDVP